MPVKEKNAPASAEPTYSYDQIPYPSHPFEATHPDHIYSMAKLFSLQPTLPDEASILELGCAAGGNIIPVAVQMPNARLVGVDLSSRQIEEGQATIEKLGLKNIELRAQDLQDVGEELGDFDYILCHGVFSWVSPEAQHRILEICEQRLTPNGVAYISYNAYPGWFMRGMIRQMMLHHTANITDPKQKIQQARALLSFIVDSTEGQDTPYAKVLKGELDLLAKHPDSYLFHEHLEENNTPLFFYQFVEMARAHNLQFLGESSLASMITSNLPPKAAEALTKLTNDVHHRSQYTDFVTNRMFRQSLLCHRDVKLNRNIDVARLSGAHFAGNFQLEDATQVQNLDPEVEVAFKCANGRRLQTKHPALKALLFTLAEAWPGAMTIDEICTRIDQRLSQLMVVGERQQIPTDQIIPTNLLQMLVRGDVEFRFLPDRFSHVVGDPPITSDLTRLQAETGQPLTTGRHAMYKPDPLTRLLIQSVDGSRTKDDLAKHVGDLAAEGKLNININGEQPVDMAAVHQATIAKILEQLRRAALLVDSGS